MLTRLATVDDAASISRHICMAEGEITELFTGYADMERASAEVAKLVLSPELCRYSWRKAIVAVIEGEVVGSVISFPADEQPALDGPMLAYLKRMRGIVLDSLFFEGVPGSYYIGTMAVDPEHRKRGIGAALLAAVEREAAAQGFSRLSLLVSPDKERTRGLYERVGYAAVDMVAIAGHPYCRMVKTMQS